FSSLERRRFFCGEEVRLNRRLCPDVYQGVVALRQLQGGGLAIGLNSPEEIPLDVAVKMRRLPENRMLDQCLELGQVNRGEIRGIAETMVAFHATTDRGDTISKWGNPEKLEAFALANFVEIRTQVANVFPSDLLDALEMRTRTDFERWMPVLRRRVDERRVVDGHGDLHARNICLTDPVTIYDCIEFSPEFRCGDVATEHAFLVMDLRYRGHPELAETYLDEVIREGGDEEIRELMPLLVRYRAMVRAKVSAMASVEPELETLARSEAVETARNYLRLSAVSAVEEDGPWWLMFCGLPGAGKSSIASRLARSSGGSWRVFSSDLIRKELAGADPTEALPAEFYAPEFSQRTYAELLRQAGLATAAGGRVVLLDANFRQRDERAAAVRAASEAGVRLALLWVDSDEDTIVGRLHHRAGDPQSVSDATHAVYRKLKEQFEPPSPEECDLLLRLPGSARADLAADEALAKLIETNGSGDAAI
ncbi:MAG: AAA family ATPase, partial [Verrucomicrobiae bacterium]|nr:AAA family ATPase [Verrucomicrobiae bacterium]